MYAAVRGSGQCTPAGSVLNDVPEDDPRHHMHMICSGVATVDMWAGRSSGTPKISYGIASWIRTSQSSVHGCSGHQHPPYIASSKAREHTDGDCRKRARVPYERAAESSVSIVNTAPRYEPLNRHSSAGTTAYSPSLSPARPPSMGRTNLSQAHTHAKATMPRGSSTSAWVMHALSLDLQGSAMPMPN